MQAAIVASLALAFQAVTAFASGAGWDADGQLFFSIGR
jgi:hypothetical protein